MRHLSEVVVEQQSLLLMNKSMMYSNKAGDSKQANAQAFDISSN